MNKYSLIRYFQDKTVLVFCFNSALLKNRAKNGGTANRIETFPPTMDNQICLKLTYYLFIRNIMNYLNILDGGILLW